MTAARFARIGLLVTTLLVGVTAVAGGVALILGSVNSSLATVLSPPVEYLDGSPFSFLQAFYFILGLAEVGLVMLALGILIPIPRHHAHGTHRQER